MYMVFNLLIVTFLVGVSAAKQHTDEDNPYEFGFTIDGQQHRHEKKDVKGIIEGEFGFITADGIYHVTVYATDENGNFRIISMRNVRVSAPLDGSPLPPGAKIETLKQGGANPPSVSPPAGVSRPASVLQPASVSRPGSALPPAPSPNPLALPDQPSTKPPSIAFTTLPTAAPSCGSCGYVTTKKPKPGDKFPSLPPLFQSPPKNELRPQNNYESQSLDGGNGANQALVPDQPVQPNQLSVPEENGEIGAGQNDLPSNDGQEYNQEQYQPQTGPNQQGFHQQGLNQQKPNRDEVNSNVHNQNNGQNENYVQNANKYQNRPEFGQNPQTGTNNQHQQSPLSQVSVTNGAIHVPGNPDIPLKDKYPGMVDGLPNGINEKDITDLLYKFNYTVGFHGHYEKGYKNGAKIGGYFVTGRDGLSQIVTYVADENGYRPKVRFERLDLKSDLVPKEETERTFGLKHFEFVWYPIS